MNSASSIRRRIAGASILVAAVAGCAGTPSALAGTSPALKDLAPTRAVDSATAKRLAELEQAGALQCVGMPGSPVDAKACAPQQPGSQAQPNTGGGAPSLGGPARDGGGIIDTNIGCRGQHGPARPGEVAMDGAFDQFSDADLQQMLAKERAVAEGRREAARRAFSSGQAFFNDWIVNHLEDDRALARAFDEQADRAAKIAEDAEARATAIEAELQRREAARGQRRNPFMRSGTRTPMPGETRGADPMAVACATMDKAGFKSQDELRQAATPALQNVCADPAKDGAQGGKVDCAPPKIETGGCVVDGGPVCVEPVSPVRQVRRVPGLKVEVPGVAGCAERKDTDCAPS